MPVRYLSRQSKRHWNLLRRLESFIVFTLSGEDLQQRYFWKEYYVKTVSQPDIDAVFETHY